jgi:hypothetical protein
MIDQPPARQKKRPREAAFSRKLRWGGELSVFLLSEYQGETDKLPTFLHGKWPFFRGSYFGEVVES